VIDGTFAPLARLPRWTIVAREKTLNVVSDAERG
jgi:hypothetical protein